MIDGVGKTSPGRIELPRGTEKSAPGDRIRVRTDRRSAPFIGQVTADGRVALPGFN